MLCSCQNNGLWKVKSVQCCRIVLTSVVVLMYTSLLARGSGQMRNCDEKSLSSLASIGMVINSAALDGASTCVITGRVTTRSPGLPDGVARFELKLPKRWSQRFVFWGVGGYGGDLGPA